MAGKDLGVESLVVVKRCCTSIIGIAYVETVETCPFACQAFPGEAEEEDRGVGSQDCSSG